MVWIALAFLFVTCIAGWLWADMIDKVNDINPDEPYDFWMTDED